MKKLLFALMLMIPSYAIAGNMVIYDENTGAIVQVFPDGGFSAPDYKHRTDVLFDIDLSLLKTVEQKYCIVNQGAIDELKQVDKDAIDAAEAAKHQTKATFDSDLRAKLAALGLTNEEVDYLMGGR